MYGDFGYSSFVDGRYANHGLEYNSNAFGYYADHSDHEDKNSTAEESGDATSDSSDSVFYSRESSKELSDDSSDSRYSHESFSSHGGSGYTHSHDSTSDYFNSTHDSHGSSASDAYFHRSSITSQFSGPDGSDDSYFSKDSVVYNHRNGRIPYSDSDYETDGSSYDLASSFSLDSEDDIYGSSIYSGASGFSWDSRGSHISSLYDHDASSIDNSHLTDEDIDRGYYHSYHGRHYQPKNLDHHYF